MYTHGTKARYCKHSLATGLIFASGWAFASQTYLSSCDLAQVRDLFHIYLNNCEFQFLRLHINKTNTFSFLINNGRVLGMAK